MPDVVIRSAADIAPTAPEPGLQRLIGAHNDKLMLAEHRMAKGWAGAAHSHPHDQVAYVVSGRLHVIAGGTAFDIAAGDSFIVRGGVEHQASALEDSVVIDVFTPCREDYIG